MANQNAGKYGVLAHKSLTVVLRDTNGQEITRAEHQTNDYGSFSGAFTAPRDRLTGQMSIEVEKMNQSQVWFNVEEYKRPKFQVEIAAPTDAVKLDKTVVLAGKAIAYTGAAIGGAKVKWRVERGVRLPYWCWWWQPPASKSIAHGSAITEPDGTFKIKFTADADQSVPAKNDPFFSYTLHADVTDATGETRSEERTVNVGFTTRQAMVTGNKWQTSDKPVELSVSTASLDGVPQVTSGKIAIHILKQPADVARMPLLCKNDWWRSGEEPQADPLKPSTWELGALVTERAFTTDAKGVAQVLVPLPTGIYRVSLETKDDFGTTVTARETVQVLDPHALHYTTKLPCVLAAPEWSVRPGETFAALWGTGYPTGRAFVELVCNGKPLRSYWTKGDSTQELIEQPVTEDLRGGFTLRVTYVRENRAYFNEHIVEVPWDNKRLTVQWETFRSKLQPGQKETWTAVLTGPDAISAIWAQPCRSSPASSLRTLARPTTARCSNVSAALKWVALPCQSLTSLGSQRARISMKPPSSFPS